MRGSDASKHYSGHCRATEIAGNQRTAGKKEIWRKKCGQRVSGTAGGRWRWQHRTELDGDKWSVAYDPLGVTKHKSSNIVVFLSYSLLFFDKPH